jgi:hypothetical protein
MMTFHIACFRLVILVVVISSAAACNLPNPNAIPAVDNKTALPATVVTQNDATEVQLPTETRTSQPSPTSTLTPTSTITLTPSLAPTAAVSPLTSPSPVAPDSSSSIYLRTNISDIAEFVKKCPNEDPAYETLRKSFIILKDGSPVGDIPCSDSFTGMPINDFTNELITVQAMRIAYYLDPGTPNYLPWTSMNLFSWMTSRVSGINLRTEPGQLYCCDLIDGKRYLVQSIQSDEQRKYKQDWTGLWSTLAYFAHEIRHMDGDYGHVNGCLAFPNPDDPAGCDSNYDVNNLGPYGIQYWLDNALLTGVLDIGISCSPATALGSMQSLVTDLNYQFRQRFVRDIPPLVTLPSEPYGGPCYDSE